MNYKVVLHTLGWVLNFEALCMLLPLICAAVYGEPYTLTFAVCIAVCLFFGILCTVNIPKNRSMYSREGYITVALSWIALSIFGALPFYFSGTIPRFEDALFETVSGFTTTGASILTDVDAMPRCMLFWRSFTHWIGGMGVLVFLVAILPLSGGTNMHLLRAESPGPSVGKLVPKIKSTAKILYGIYTVLTIIQIILLLCGGMSLFEALTISFGTAGTGGFAVRSSGMADYSSYIQNVVTVFMIIFGIDFSVYYLILMRRFKSALRSDEVRAYLGIIAAATVIICINSYGAFRGLGDALKHSAFQVASIITTTGYATVDFDRWPELSKAVLVVLMFIGACAGSTGGGIKVSRIVILFKTIVKELKITAHPKSVHKVTMSGRQIEHETVRAINVFIASYLMIFVASFLILSIDNFSFTTNFTAVATTINNVGPGLDLVGPVRNFSIYSPLSKLVMIFNMLVGRLEIFPMLILFSPYTWKK